MTESIVLGGGCFWCLEAVYQRIGGVTEVQNGYAGGSTQNPTYWDLHKPGNDHAEVVQVTFDAEKNDLETILTIFWTLHDPSTLNQQGADIGVEYRSIILYSSDEQRRTVDTSVENTAKKLWPKITTEIKPLETFWPAEQEQQDFFNKHPEQAYCQIVINPKLNKLRTKFSHLLR